MSAHTGVVINAQTVEHARKEARSGFSSPVVNIIAGFLSGFIGTWIGILYALLVYIQELFFSADSKGFPTFGQRSSFAWGKAMHDAGVYAAADWKWAIVAGIFGIVLALLRAWSARTDSYVQVRSTETGAGLWGYHSLLMNVGIPVVLFLYLGLGGYSWVYWMIILVILSGFIFNWVWTRLHNAFLSALSRQTQDQSTADALKILLPRQVGGDKVQVQAIKINDAEKFIELNAWFADEKIQAECKKILGDLLRGYTHIRVNRVEGRN